ncbi:MAG: Rrf2 family transcriptional regulator [Pseudomonadota bacterium]|nr:Rrf2 family transcriptional regulator [Pseudomonadota bacterium]MED5274536.1 Rrf2 family transcriptional regulator [Pseudomonadota bacterium]|tara:strand:- start:1031 stop:1489 length:459 start_codon:yes stop_codon:yes gene_type:complete
MKLTTKGRYAIVAMIDIALYTSNTPISLSEISKRQNISLSYLEQLFSKLKTKSLVKSVRGPGGGYKLDRNPSKITLFEIITAVDENMDQTQCGGAMNCNNDKPCLTHYVWTDLTKQINDYMKGVSLGDVILRNDIRNIVDKRREQGYGNKLT